MKSEEGQQIILSFDDSNLAEGNQFAAELTKHLRSLDSSFKLGRVRDDPDAMDGGATIVALLTTKAVITIAGGIAAWLSMRPRARLSIKTSDGTIVASGLRSRDARESIEQHLNRAASIPPTTKESSSAAAVSKTETMRQRKPTAKRRSSPRPKPDLKEGAKKRR